MILGFAGKIRQTKMSLLNCKIRIEPRELLEMKAECLKYNMRIIRGLKTALFLKKFLKTDIAFFAQEKRVDGQD